MGSATRTVKGIASPGGASVTSSPRKPSVSAPDPRGAGRVWPPSTTLPALASTGMKFIGGEPTKPPTNIVAGLE